MGADSFFAPRWAVARRNELVEAVFQEHGSDGLVHSDCVALAFARYIAAHEEAPVDPMLIEAREIVKATLSERSHSKCNCRTEIDAGKWDNGHKMVATVAALRRGIELAKAGEA